MLYSSNYNLILTGTDFGELINYPKANYLDGYFFSDLFGNTNITYSNTICGNVFLSSIDPSNIGSLPGLIAWVDTSDISKVLTGTSMTGVTGITAIIDKSPYSRTFKANTFIELTDWPIPSENQKPAARLRSTNYFYNSTICLSLTSPFTLIYVWKDINEIPGDNYPLCLQTEFEQITGEIVLINNYITNTSKWGYRESTYGILITGTPFKEIGENYFTWTHTGGTPLSTNTQYLEVLNLPITATDSYYISGGPPLAAKATTIGSLCGEWVNDFIFGEMLLFNRVVSGNELIDVKNAINKKWNFSSYMENLNYYYTVTGGILSSTSYEDFSALTSIITIPIQSCVTLLTLNLSAFDITVSEVSKVQVEYNDIYKEITSNLEVVGNDIKPILKNNKIDLVLMPDKNNYVSTYTISLSVYRFDSTVNKFILSGNLLKCNVLDYFKNSNLIDAQILDNINDILLVNEDPDKKIIFLNRLNVEAPVQILTGGDVEVLQNIDVISPEDDVILLSDLLDDESEEQPLKVPIIPPLPRPRINPIQPS